MDVDSDVFIESSQAFIRALIGANNWPRWIELREQSQVPNMHAFFTWLLDAGETQLEQERSLVLPGEGVGEKGDEFSVADDAGGNTQRFYVKSEQTTSTNLAQQHDSVGPMRSKGVARKGESHMMPYHHPPPQQVFPEHSDAPTDLLPYPDTESGEREPVLTFGDANFSDSAFFCHHCNIHLNKMDAAMMHLSKVHSSEHLTITCVYCRQSHATPHHFMESHGTGCQWRLVCPYCQKQFSSKAYLKAQGERMGGSDLTIIS